MGRVIRGDDPQELDELKVALSDSLFLFWDMAVSYQGFGQGVDTGSFDPFRFIDATSDSPALAGGIELARIGAGVALLCLLAEEMTAGVASGFEGSELRLRTRDLLSSGAVDDRPEIRVALEAALKGEEALRETLPDVYAEYVKGYLRRLYRRA
jgi:hypothetical protein